MNIAEYFEAIVKGPQRVLIYSGRFHPPGPHHFKIYERLQEIASKIDAELLLAMSPLVDGDANPYTFQKRKKIWELAVPGIKIIEVGDANLYKPDAFADKKDFKKYVHVVALGQKDQEGDRPRLVVGGQLKKGGNRYFQTQVSENELDKISNIKTADKEGGVLIMNTIKASDTPENSSKIRALIASKNKKGLEKIYKDYPNIVRMLIK